MKFSEKSNKYKGILPIAPRELSSGQDLETIVMFITKYRQAPYRKLWPRVQVVPWTNYKRKLQCTLLFGINSNVKILVLGKDLSQQQILRRKSTEMYLSTFKFNTGGEREDVQFETWIKQKKKLNQNIERVCRKYEKTVKEIKWKPKKLIYDSEHNLLLCLNNKVFLFHSKRKEEDLLKRSLREKWKLLKHFWKSCHCRKPKCKKGPPA